MDVEAYNYFGNFKNIDDKIIEACKKQIGSTDRKSVQINKIKADIFNNFGYSLKYKHVEKYWNTLNKRSK